MAVAIDTSASVVTTTHQSSGHTFTLSYTMGSVTNGILIVSLSMWLNGGTPSAATSVKLGTTAFTAVGNGVSNTNGIYTEQWYLINPASGAGTINVVSGSTLDKLGIAGVSFSGADQTTGVDVSSSATGTVATVTKAVTTTLASEYLVDAVMHFSANLPTSSTGTQVYKDSGSTPCAACQYASAASAGSNSMSWTFPDSGDDWAYSVLAVKAASSSVNASVAQVAATVSATGGTQSIATASSAAITQSAASVTATGGTQNVATVNDASISQVAASITASGGTQAVATVNDVSIIQSAATVTVGGGTQTIIGETSASITQSAASVTVSGGLQTTDIGLGQSAASITATGGTQAVSALQNVSISQTAAAVLASGGVQIISTVSTVSVSQSAANLITTGGSQDANGEVTVAVTQIAGSITATGGVQSVSAVSGTVNASVAQSAASITATGGLQIITTSTSPLPPHKSPSMVFLTDGHIALRLANTVYLPL